MRITCDYCGASFDTDSNSSCPKCGGGYGEDMELQGKPDNYREQLYMQEKAQKEAEKKERFDKRQAELDGQVKKIKLGCLITVIVIAALIAFPIIVANLDGEEAAVFLNSII